MLIELIRAFFLVFVAEMGDKTQIIAMTFATKYRVKEVLLGVVLGVVLNHGLAILLGRFILNFISLNKIQLLASLVFIIFAFMSLQDEEEDEEENSREYGPIFTVAMAFFLGELGDKTQLTAMTLATSGSYPLVILMGTTLAMVATSGLGIFVGSKIGGKIEDLYIKITSSVIFLIFGLAKLYSIAGYSNTILYITGLVLALEAILISRLIKTRKKILYSPMQIAAEKLYRETQDIKDVVDNICLGEGTCGTCQGDQCLVGYIKGILNLARDGNNYLIEDHKLIEDLELKNFNENNILAALATIIYTARKNHWELEGDFVVNLAKEYLETYLLGSEIGYSIYSKSYLKEFRKRNSQYGLRLERILNSF